MSLHIFHILFCPIIDHCYFVSVRGNLNLIGEMPEWLNGAVSKTVVRLRRTQGSNPCLSAKTFSTVLTDGAKSASV